MNEGKREKNMEKMKNVSKTIKKKKKIQESCEEERLGLGRKERNLESEWLKRSIKRKKKGNSEWIEEKK